MPSPDKKMMYKGWSDTPFSQIREAFQITEDAMDSELVPVVKMKRGLAKCKKNGHQMVLIEEVRYTFWPGTCRKFECMKCKKRKVEFEKE